MGLEGTAGDDDAAMDAEGFEEAAVTVAEDATAPLVGAGVVEAGRSARIALSGGDIGSALTCVGAVEGVVAASGAWGRDELEGSVSRLGGMGSSVLTGGVGEAVVSIFSGLGGSTCCAMLAASHGNVLRRCICGLVATKCVLTAPRFCRYRRVWRRILCVVRHLLMRSRFIQRAFAVSQPSRGCSGGLRSKPVEHGGLLM